MENYKKALHSLNKAFQNWHDKFSTKIIWTWDDVQESQKTIEKINKLNEFFKDEAEKLFRSRPTGTGYEIR